MRNSILKIMGFATVALIIPALGNQFVEGWNWSWHDFLFAWVFWVVMATSIYFMTSKITNTNYQIPVGVAVFLMFAAVWVLLATG